MITTTRRPVHRISRHGAVLGTRHGGASRGGPRHKVGTQRFGPCALGCTAAPS
jgi:hypothetical protein